MLFVGLILASHTVAQVWKFTMLKDLRTNRFAIEQPWTIEKQRGLCANKDCRNVAGKECGRCGLRYCSAACQKADWKLRHKNHCEPKDIRKTEIAFILFQKRLKDYTDGRTSVDRYYSIATMLDYKDYFPLHEDPAKPTPCYETQNDSRSGRAASVLEDHENSNDCGVFRKRHVYIANRAVPTLPLTEKHKQMRMEAGLPVREATELIPLKGEIQKAFAASFCRRIVRLMRLTMYEERQLPLLLIEITINLGIGYGYGNPVFLNLQNMIAYEDYVQKNFGEDNEFPFNLCCSILYPEFNLSLRTGKAEDADKVLGCDSEQEFISKSAAAPRYLVRNWAMIFHKESMKQEDQEERQVYDRRDGESFEEHMERIRNYNFVLDPFKYGQFTMNDACPDSLAVFPAHRSAFKVSAKDGDLISTLDEKTPYGCCNSRDSEGGEGGLSAGEGADEGGGAVQYEVGLETAGLGAAAATAVEDQDNDTEDGVSGGAVQPDP